MIVELSFVFDECPKAIAGFAALSAGRLWCYNVVYIGPAGMSSHLLGFSFTFCVSLNV